MKKTFLFVIILVSILVGCNSKHIFLSGESESWKGEYSAYINGNREDGNYLFGYKNGEKDTKFKNLEIIINVNDGETVLKEDNHEGATVRIPTSCSGCAVTREDEPIKVTIKWDDKNEETFYLK
jgi:major membrane immunogen (membrane-anchored lipoprotein)